MKKIFISLFSFILILTGGIFSSRGLSSQAADLLPVYEISTGEQFVQTLARSEIYDTELVVLKLTNDIDMKDIDLTLISEINGTFKGTFEGNGYSISNISFTSFNQYYGIFPKAVNAIIQNVKIAGDINYTFSETNIKEIYAGILVGYAENVQFKNCEFDSSLAQDKTIELPIYSDFNFGALAGKIKGNPLANSSGNRANIRDCVNYYNFDITLYKQSNVYIGGLVGNLQNAYILNTLNFGNINFANALLDGGDSANINKQYVGGIVGAVSGSGTHLRNSCYGGSFDIASVVSNLKFFKGAILGGALDGAVQTSNINFDYFTDDNIGVCGDDYVKTNDKLKNVDVLNEAFLKNTTNFDAQSQNTPFDFNTTWSLSESRFHLQNFMLFSYSFNSSLSPYINAPKFFVKEGVYEDTISSRYGLPVYINVSLKPEYVGFFTLKKATLTDNPYFKWAEATMEAVKNSKGQDTGYIITVSANATTKGTYSFDIESEKYVCEVAVSEDAITEQQGLVRIADSNIATPRESIPLTFTYNSDIKKVAAEATSGSVYAFECWKLYYLDENGEYSTEEVPFANSTDSILSISFGTAPFDREFKLEAHFTDKDAIQVNFGELDTKKIKSIKFGGIDYVGLPIAVSPNQAKNLEIVTNKDYKLDVTAFVNAISILYGDNSTETLITADPEENQAGETTYKFSINMRYMEELSKNSLRLDLNVEFDDSNNQNDLLWLWITIAGVGVLIIGIVIFVIVRRRGRGKGGKGGKVARVKEKKVSYKDFY